MGSGLIGLRLRGFTVAGLDERLMSQLLVDGVNYDALVANWQASKMIDRVGGTRSNFPMTTSRAYRGRSAAP